ncbi:glycosyltransferase family 4 protein [uncultured Coprobacter sp.]|uniref:glycosyltransferase family 4 protein n=1 Tax=uncultured Coprobacter sp. TaxID=1720550 RepID=UPI00261A4305|nr:glycosyltransferase family 4 protein [uncultured Coprobacter sp.]
MEIAFILSYPRIVPTDGVVGQANTWKKGLEKLGHAVTLINMWEENNWKQFDIILFFGFNEYMQDIIKWLYPINPHIVVAPILDPNYSLIALKCYSHWGCNKLRLNNPYHALRSCKEKVKQFLVRSEYEKLYLSQGFGIPASKCRIIPLSYNVNPESFENEREPFCLHISLLCDARKNVKRLIDASVKYNFKLVLGGILRNEQEKKLLDSWIRDKPNVTYVGYISYDTMLDLYKRAKVFALPSIYEGVGIVALDAAAMGCDIVITQLGGPKEYYNNMAVEVNPYSIDEIGLSVSQLMQGQTFQPDLRKYILENYSLKNISEQLEMAFSIVL